MANLLDLNLIGFLAPAVIVIFIFGLVYALLMKLKLFGDDNKGMNALIAFCVAMLVIINVNVTRVLVEFVPMVFAFLLLLVFIFIVFIFMGVSEKDLGTLIKEESTIWVTVLSVVVILFFVAMTSVFGPFLLVTDKPGFFETAKRTLLHPRILGAVFIIIVASYVVRTFEIPVPGIKK